jgi:hypothetical protein
MYRRRLIKLIFAGRSRIIMIRRELPLTTNASPAKPVANFRRGCGLAEQLGILASGPTLLRQLRRKVIFSSAQAPWGTGHRRPGVAQGMSLRHDSL